MPQCLCKLFVWWQSARVSWTRTLATWAVTAALLVSASAWGELPQRIQRVASVLKVGSDEISLWVQAVDEARPLLVHLPDQPRVPASTLKLLTTFAALQELTPSFRWRTEAWALGQIRDGVLRGDLLLKGSGDPYLVTEEYWKFVSGIRNAGVKRIEGDLIFDTSYFQLPKEDPAAFDNRPDRLYNTPPHPLLVNFNAATFKFMPAGRSVHVKVEPQLSSLSVKNLLRLVKKGCYGYQRGVNLNVLDGVAQRDQVLLTGRFPRGCGEYALARTVLSPEGYAFDLFGTYWRQAGGTLGGRWRIAELPKLFTPGGGGEGEAQGELLYVHESPFLGELVRLVNKYSNNVMSRHLHLTLGAEHFGGPATLEKGDDAVRKILELHQINTQGIVLDNASGLTRDARITARQLAQLLLAAWKAPYMPEFLSSLSLAGLDGTARRRLRDQKIAGYMHLKTGSLDEVSTIAGYVQSKSGVRYAVVVLINGPLAHRGPGMEIQDKVLEWVHSYEQERNPGG